LSLQAPYRSDWHPGERVWNGVQTSKCRFQPGPQEGDPAGVCCTPWITQQVKCPLVSTHVELNHVLQEFPDVAKGAAEVAVDTAAQVPACDPRSDHRRLLPAWGDVVRSDFGRSFPLRAKPWLVS